MPARPSALAWRTFVAAPVPDEAAARLWRALEPLRGRYPSARWAKLEQLHATLVFLGQTRAADVPRLEAALDASAANHAPFEVETIDAGGRADDRRGGVAWLRLDDPQHRLRDLAR